MDDREVAARHDMKEERQFPGRLELGFGGAFRHDDRRHGPAAPGDSETRGRRGRP